MAPFTSPICQPVNTNEQTLSYSLSDDVQLLSRCFRPTGSSLAFYIPLIEPVIDEVQDWPLTLSPFVQLDSCTVWKGLTLTDAEELFEWEQTFRAQLKRTLFPKLLYIHSTTKGKKPRKGGMAHGVTINIPRLTRAVVRHFQNQASAQFRWFASFGDVYQIAEQFIRSHECFFPCKWSSDESDRDEGDVEVLAELVSSIELEHVRSDIELEWNPSRLGFAYFDRFQLAGGNFKLTPRYELSTNEWNDSNAEGLSIRYSTSTKWLRYDEDSECFTGLVPLPNPSQPLFEDGDSRVFYFKEDIVIQALIVERYGSHVNLERRIRASVTIYVDCPPSVLCHEYGWPQTPPAEKASSDLLRIAGHPENGRHSNGSSKSLNIAASRWEQSASSSDLRVDKVFPTDLEYQNDVTVLASQQTPNKSEEDRLSHVGGSPFPEGSVSLHQASRSPKRSCNIRQCPRSSAENREMPISTKPAKHNNSVIHLAPPLEDLFYKKTNGPNNSPPPQVEAAFSPSPVDPRTLGSGKASLLLSNYSSDRHNEGDKPCSFSPQASRKFKIPRGAPAGRLRTQQVRRAKKIFHTARLGTEVSPAKSDKIQPGGLEVVLPIRSRPLLASSPATQRTRDNGSATPVGSSERPPSRLEDDSCASIPDSRSSNFRLENPDHVEDSPLYSTVRHQFLSKYWDCNKRALTRASCRSVRMIDGANTKRSSPPNAASTSTIRQSPSEIGPFVRSGNISDWKRRYPEDPRSTDAGSQILDSDHDYSGQAHSTVSASDVTDQGDKTTRNAGNEPCSEHSEKCTANSHQLSNNYAHLSDDEKLNIAISRLELDSSQARGGVTVPSRHQDSSDVANDCRHSSPNHLSKVFHETTHAPYAVPDTTPIQRKFERSLSDEIDPVSQGGDPDTIHAIRYVCDTVGFDGALNPEQVREQRKAMLDTVLADHSARTSRRRLRKLWGSSFDLEDIFVDDDDEHINENIYRTIDAEEQMNIEPMETLPKSPRSQGDSQCKGKEVLTIDPTPILEQHSSPRLFTSYGDSGPWRHSSLSAPTQRDETLQQRLEFPQPTVNENMPSYGGLNNGGGEEEQLSHCCCGWTMPTTEAGHSTGPARSDSGLGSDLED